MLSVRPLSRIFFHLSNSLTTAKVAIFFKQTLKCGHLSVDNKVTTVVTLKGQNKSQFMITRSCVIIFFK